MMKRPMNRLFPLRTTKLTATTLIATLLIPAAAFTLTVNKIITLIKLEIPNTQIINAARARQRP